MRKLLIYVKKTIIQDEYKARVRIRKKYSTHFSAYLFAVRFKGIAGFFAAVIKRRTLIASALIGTIGFMLVVVQTSSVNHFSVEKNKRLNFTSFSLKKSWYNNFRAYV